METPVDFRPGTWSYAGVPWSARVPGAAQPPQVAALGRRLAAAGQLEGDHPRGDEGAAGQVPLLPAVHGHLRALRRLRGQVPLLPRLRRPQEHAGAAGRAAARGLPQAYFTIAGKLSASSAGAPRPDGRRAQGVVLLLLPVHRVPALLGLLPLRHRHRRDHDDRARAAQPGRAQHQLDHGAGGQLLPHRQPPGRSSPTPSRTTSSSPPTISRTSRASRSRRRSTTARAPRCWWWCPRRTTSANPHYFTFLGYLALLPRDRAGLHLQLLRLRGRQLRPLHLATR